LVVSAVNAFREAVWSDGVSIQRCGILGILSPGER
jgi:hypothetical protein